jgi:glucose/arabinose dehydrogenase/cytochrome c2
MIGFPRRWLFLFLALAFGAAGRAEAQAPAPAPALAPPVGAVAAGQMFFSQSCALCHAAVLGPGNIEIEGQGPSLVGVFGRKAGKAASFPYSSALSNSGLKWNAATLDKFLADPGTLVPGTKMVVAISDPNVRANLVAYLKSLKVPPNVKLARAPKPGPALPPSKDPGAWQNAAPGVAHHITIASLPRPYLTPSIDNSVLYVKPPGDEDLQTTPAGLAVPPGFTVKLFAKNLSNPRCLRVAPNGDIFLAESGANRIHVFRSGDGCDAPTIDQVYASNLDQPFGVAFYPPGNDPRWLYVANNNSVVRFPYRNGDVQAAGPPEVVVPKLYGGQGGHFTRDIAFSLDGTRMYISVGSASQVGEGIEQKTPAEIKAWEAEHGVGAAWGFETNRADILVTDPEGKLPLRAYATGIRNGVGIAVNPLNGDLWTSVNERDGLGDNLVPDYITRVKEGGFYGWPWYYLGKFKDPRWKGARPDLAGKVTVPDVLIQAHSASLEMCFYNATSGPALFPAEYRGDIFAAEHGSYNRHNRTGYKVIRVRLKNGVPTGEYDDFLTGFVVDDGSAWGRPVGVAVAHDGALLVSEDDNSSIWRVAYRQ